jgi:hypothetical protein
MLNILLTFLSILRLFVVWLPQRFRIPVCNAGSKLLGGPELYDLATRSICSQYALGLQLVFTEMLAATHFSISG